MDLVVQTAFWNAPLAQLLMLPEANSVLAVNAEACKFFQAERPALEKSSASNLFRDALAELVVFTDEAILKGHAWSDTLTVTKPASGEKIRVEVAARAVDSDQGPQLLMTIQDAEQLMRQRNRGEAHRHYRSGIGQWQRMAMVFQEFEKENQLILNAAGEGIYGVDADGLTSFVNPAAERLLGWQTEELIGKNIHALIHFRHADGSHYHVAECPIYQAFREGIVTQVDDDVFWRKDGSPIDVEYTSTPIKDNGHIVGAVVIFRDVTEKKNAQHKLLGALQEVESLKRRLEMENAYLQEEINSKFNHHQIVGKSAAISSVIQKIELVAPTDATVLISGESGTGKELIARAIHDLSQRGKRSLIRVNCAAIPADLFESEFFGHAKGAFTGAVAERPGRFELADGGTLFLDEVGEIPLALQGKLLRVLQEQQLERVGEAKTRKVNVRILAATNRDLSKLVEGGAFREDLYFRLNVFPIESVPLRNRIEDIPVLAQHFLQKASRRASKGRMRISLGQLEKLKSYHWPGNIRELENIIERQVILSQDGTLQFDEFISQPLSINKQPDIASANLLTEAERKRQEVTSVVEALKQTKGKVFGKEGAAELLGLKPTTLASRIKRLQIDPSEFKSKTIEAG